MGLPHEAAVVCYQHVEGAATEAGPLLTVAFEEVLGTGPALDAFKGPLFLRIVAGGGGAMLWLQEALPTFPWALGRGLRALLLSTYSRQCSA